MKEILLLKIGEVVLKGLNRRTFEDILIKNIKRSLNSIGKFSINIAQSTIYVIPQDDSDEDILDAAEERISKIFGIATFSRACFAKKDMDGIKQTCISYLKEQLLRCKSFKVESKRADKRFCLKSPQISAEIGGFILEKFPHIKVDVHNPDIIITIEIRETGAYIRGEAIQGAGGLPIGTGGKAAILISGGIDSPVAAWTIAKRGVELTAIHFASPPYTSPRAEQKVEQLLEKVAKYSGSIKMIVVPFTKIQEQIKDNCPEELFTIIMRRFMMKIAERIAINDDCSALITGESLGQVASQTIGAISCTDEAVAMPIFRPLIGMDKNEIVNMSRKIDTFNISIQPYEDCCTVFTPKHPRTKPILKFVKEAEQKLDMEDLIQDAIEKIKIKDVI